MAMTRTSVVVDHPAENLEQVRHPMHLVEHDEPGSLRSKIGVGVVEPSPVRGTLQVEVATAGWPGIRQVPRQGGLADLAWAEQGHRCRIGQPRGHLRGGSPGNYACKSNTS